MKDISDRNSMKFFNNVKNIVKYMFFSVLIILVIGLSRFYFS